MRYLRSLDFHDLIALVLVIGGLIVYYIRPSDEVLAIITMITGFYFGRNFIKRRDI